MLQGWRPPGASTAIRPSRVVGWPAPIATLVILLELLCVFPKGKIVDEMFWPDRPGFLSLVQGRPRAEWALAWNWLKLSACGPYGPRGFKSHSRRHETSARARSTRQNFSKKECLFHEGNSFTPITSSSNVGSVSYVMTAYECLVLLLRREVGF